MQAAPRCALYSVFELRLVNFRRIRDSSTHEHAHTDVITRAFEQNNRSPYQMACSSNLLAWQLRDKVTREPKTNDVKQLNLVIKLIL